MKCRYIHGFYLILLLLLSFEEVISQRKWGKEDLSVYKKEAPFIALRVDKIPAFLSEKVIKSFQPDGIVIAQHDLPLFQQYTLEAYSASATFKLSQQLFNKWTELKDLPFSGMIQLFPVTESVPEEFSNYHFEWIYQPKGIAKITDYPRLGNLVENHHIVFIDLLKTASPEGYTGWADLSLHNITSFRKQLHQTQLPVISVREGMIDRQEIDLQGQLLEHPGQPVTVTNHASQMAILVAGQANTSFNAMGAVPGAKFVLERMSSFFPLMSAPYASPLQLNSYGTDLEWHYGVEAQTYDEFILQHKTLFVFSSGNSGAITPTDGNYKGIAGFSNLTGSFKQAKNNLLIGGLESVYSPPVYSSSGPTFDGRVKPELVAIADNGTSSSAAVAVGIAAGVYSVLPAAQQRNDLVKAILISAADEIKTTGISYHTGYGLINAGRAVQVALNSQYLTDNISPGETKQHPINIPQGTYTVRITMVWNDPPAIVNASKTLVNDLDFHLEKNSQKVYPWVLSAYASADSLNAVAQRKKDDRNVVELITDTLNGGTYQLVVDGNLLVQEQSYAIAYELLPVQRFRFTHPSKDDIIQEGMNQYIRWDTDLQVKAKLSYKNTKNNENGWIEVDTVDTRFPLAMFSDFTDVASYELRMETDNATYYSDTFLVMPQMNLRQQYLCDKEALFKLFNETTQPLTYHLQQFDSQSKEWITKQSLPDVLFTQNITADNWWRVGMTLEGKELYPTHSILVKGNEEVCFQGTLLVDALNEQAALNFQTWALHFIDKVSLEKIIQHQWQPIHQFNTVELGNHTFTDRELVYGSNVYRAKVLLKNGKTVYTPEQSVVHISSKDVWVYPNPVKASLPVEVVLKDPLNMRLFLYSNEGRLIRQIPVRDVRTTINTTGLLPGVYLLAMVYETKLTTVKKIIIQ